MLEKEKALICKAQLGDKKSLEQLIVQNNGLIWSVVRKFWYRDEEPEDLYQIACIGFIKAVKRFDFAYHVELSTYAAAYCMGEIRKFLRDDGILKIARNIKELGAKIRNVKKVYGEHVSISKMAEILRVSEEEIRTAMDCGKKVESINQYIYENGKCQMQEKIVADNKEDEVINKILIQDLVNKLKLRDREIIRMRYFHEKTQTQVAHKMGISQVQVSRIERRLLKQLGEELSKGEVTN